MKAIIIKINQQQPEKNEKKINKKQFTFTPGKTDKKETKKTD